MTQKRLILLISLMFVIFASFSGMVEAGVSLLIEAGKMEVGVPSRQLANLSCLALMPFVFGGMLLAVHHMSAEWALKISQYAVLLVGMVGGALNYFFVFSLLFFL